VIITAFPEIPDLPDFPGFPVFSGLSVFSDSRASDVAVIACMEQFEGRKEKKRLFLLCIEKISLSLHKEKE